MINQNETMTITLYDILSHLYDCVIIADSCPMLAECCIMLTDCCIVITANFLVFSSIFCIMFAFCCIRPVDFNIDSLLSNKPLRPMSTYTYNIHYLTLPG